MKPRVSIVVPAYNEGSAIEEFLGRLLEAVELPCEMLVVVDTPDDTTVPYVEKYAGSRLTRPATAQRRSDRVQRRPFDPASKRHWPMSSW